MMTPKLPDPCNDTDLIRAYRGGDRAALGVLFERYHPMLVQILERRCGDSGRAEDAAMDAWTIAQVKLNRFDESKSFINWLIAIGKNRLTSNWRHDQRQQAIGGDSQELEQLRQQQPGEVPFDGAVIETLERLPPDVRQLLVWKYMEDYSLKEIGERLDIPPGTVGNRLWRARAQFQAAFLRTLGEDGAGKQTRPTPGM